MTLREHYQFIEKQTGKKKPELHYEIPEYGKHLFDTFWLELVRFPYQPLTYTELRSYMEITGNELSPWEVDAIMRMDKVVNVFVHKKED